MGTGDSQFQAEADGIGKGVRHRERKDHNSSCLGKGDCSSGNSGYPLAQPWQGGHCVCAVKAPRAQIPGWLCRLPAACSECAPCLVGVVMNGATRPRVAPGAVSKTLLALSHHQATI